MCVCACLETHDEQLVRILLKLIFVKRAKTTTPFGATMSCCAATCAPFVSRSLPRVGGGVVAFYVDLHATVWLKVHLVTQ